MPLDRLSAELAAVVAEEEAVQLLQRPLRQPQPPLAADAAVALDTTPEPLDSADVVVAEATVAGAISAVAVAAAVVAAAEVVVAAKRPRL